MSGRSGKPSIRDVASLAGVALSSVSRVLNNHPDVSEEMRARVLAATEELGYEPDLVASGLRSGTTKTVGLLVTDIANPLFSEIAKGAGASLQEAGYSLVLMNSDGDGARDEKSVRVLSQRRVDGLVLSVSDETSESFTATLRTLDLPVVLLDREMPGYSEATAVLSDHRAGMKAAVDHLVMLGHERIALLVGPESIRPNRERRAGFAAAMRDHGLDAPPGFVVAGPALSAAFGQEAASRLLEGPTRTRPTALIAGGNQVLTGVLEATRGHDVHPGRDLALISCDDVPLARLHEPAITVIARDTIRMGRCAASLLLARLGDDTVAGQSETLPTELVVRESTRAMSLSSRS